MDTIYFYECSGRVTELKEMIKGRDKVVLGENCKSVFVASYEPIGKEEIKQKFYYSGKQSVAKNAYRNFRDGYLSEIYAITKSHILMWEFEQSQVAVSFEAIKIEAQEIDETIFNIPRGIARVRH